MPASRPPPKTNQRQLKATGCEKVFREKITGTTADRPQLKKLMKALAPGDVVITPAVDRLSRDTTDLLVIARHMQRAGAGIRSLAEPFLRYHIRLRRDRLRHPWRCGEARTPPHSRPTVHAPPCFHFTDRVSNLRGTFARSAAERCAHSRPATSRNAPSQRNARQK
jgi:hypothetical protein